MEGLMLIVLYFVIALACASSLGVSFSPQEAYISLMLAVWVS